MRVSSIHQGEIAHLIDHSGVRSQVQLLMVLIFYKIRDLPRAADIHKYFLATHLHGVTRHSRRLVVAPLPSGHVKTPTMPGAGDHITVQWPLTQGSPAVNTSIADSVKFPRHVGHRDRFSLRLNFVDRTGS